MPPTITRSPRRTLTLRNNRLWNPAARRSAVGYTVEAGTGGTATITRIAGISPPPALAGDVSTAFSATWSTAATAGRARIAAPSFGTTAGSTYTFRFWARRSTAGILYLSVDWLLGASFITQNQTAEQTVSASTWTEITATFTAPPGTDTVVLYVRAGTAVPSGFVLHTTGLYAAAGLELGNWFDGDSPAVEPSFFAWMNPATPDTTSSGEFIYNPVDVTVPLLMLGYEDTNTVFNQVHDVIGASLPIVTVQPLGGRKGTLRLLFADAGQAWTFRESLVSAESFTLRDPDVPDLRMVFALGSGDVSVQLDPETLLCWTVELPFVQTGNLSA